MGKLIVDLDDPLHKALRLICLRENLTIKEKVTALLREALFAEQAVSIDEALARELDEIKATMERGEYTTLEEHETRGARAMRRPQAQRRLRR